MKKLKSCYMTIAAGLLLFFSGAALLKFIPAPEGVMQTLPFVLIGVGCGIFGHGIGNLINRRLADKNPDFLRQQTIEQNDERNIALSNQAKAKAFDLSLFVFAALMLSFALMQAQFTLILLLLVAYAAVIAVFIYYLNRYHKEM